MKTFRTVGSGASQTLEKIENNKIPVYETKAAAEADIANLSDGQIIATKDEGNENAKPVDVVEKGNLHAVTSNAVADVLGSLGEKITNYWVGNGYKFNGTIIKVGKIVFVDGKIVNTISDNEGTIIGDIPENKSGVNKDQNVFWLSPDSASIAGYSILSFNNGSYGLSIGIGRAPIGSAQVSFSYITN